MSARGLIVAALISALAPAAVAQTASPGGLASDTELLNFVFTPAPAAKDAPKLLQLTTDSARERWSLAQAEAEDLRREVDPTHFRKNELEIADQTAFRDARLISIERAVYIDTGGAHPNTDYDSVLWDVVAGRAIGLRDLFVNGALPPALRAAWRERLERMKQDRGSEDGAQALTQWLDTTPLVLEDTPFVLARSTVSGKAGGLVFIHAPYQVGAYVEGAYRVAAPLETFAAALKPAYRDSFAGAPAEDR